MSTRPATPECERISQVAKESFQLSTFIDWLSENGFTICEWSNETQGYERPVISTNALLARYFEIDLNKVEQERRALLDWIRKQYETQAE
jgi:uncharacterized tellurite resistance protein B-like protein